MRAVERVLTAVTGLLNRRPWVAIFLLAAIYLPAVLAQSRKKPLWHDEIVTYYISAAPTLSATLQQCGMDLNPPLSYLLTHLSFKLFSPSTLACRLPEIVAFFCAMLSLFAFVKRRMGAVYGMLAAALLFSSTVGELALEARPYAIMLAATSLSLLAWQKATEKKEDRVFALCLLLLTGSALLLNHIFGLLAWAALLTAEIVRVVSSRRFDWKPIAVWMLPLFSIFAYAPMLRSHGSSAFPVALQPTARSAAIFYINHLTPGLIALPLTAVLLFIVLGRVRPNIRPGWYFSASEWLAIAGLVAAPAFLIVYLRLSHGAFFPRYGVIAAVGCSLVFTAGLGRWSRLDQRAALLGTLVALFLSGRMAAAAYGLPLLLQPHIVTASEPVIEPCQACLFTAAIQPGLPLVDASGLTFVEMNFRESQSDLARIYYLTDPVASLQFAHANIFEGMQREAEAFSLRANVAAYATFVHLHHHFFVLGQRDYPEDWLLRKLEADGADIRLRGHVAGQYKDHEIYEVTI